MIAAFASTAWTQAAPPANSGPVEVRITEQNDQAVNGLARFCGKDTTCFKREIDKLAAEARSSLSTTARALSPQLEAILTGNCSAIQKGADHRSIFLQATECQLNWLGRVSEEAKELLSPAMITGVSFERFLKNKSELRPLPWYVVVHQRACAEAKSSFDCFQKQMMQIHADAAIGAVAYSAYQDQVTQAMALTHRFCKIDSRACVTQGLQLSQIQLAPHDPARPFYSPTAAASVAPGALDGAKRGAQGCGVDAQGKPNDCNLQALVSPTDPGWAVEGAIASCPAFLKPYNCLSLGSNLAGDLSNVRNAPYFYASRERMCRERVRARLCTQPNGKFTSDYECGFEALAKKWGNAERATASHSPACDYWTRQLHQEDPVPLLSREEIDTARVSPDGKLHDTLMSIADIASKSGLQRDLGGFSVQKQAMGLFQVQANLEPGVLADMDSTAYNKTVQELMSAASCLADSEKFELGKNFERARLKGLDRASEISSQKPMQDALWVADLTKNAKKAVELDTIGFDLGVLWGRMQCGGASLGDAHHCLKVDYLSVAKAGKEVSPEIYATRLRWLRQGLPAAMEGLEVKTVPGRRELNQDPGCAYVSCADLGLAIRAVRARHNELISRNPLIGEATGESEKRRSCGSDPAEISKNRLAWSSMRASSAALGNYPAMWLASALGADESACQRPQVLADQLNKFSDPGARLAAARDAAAKVKSEGLESIRKICAKPDGLTEEGEHASGVQILSEEFLKCADIGEGSSQCADRRSYGWAFCRLNMQNVGESNTAYYKHMLTGMAMAAGGGLAIAATGGGAAVVGGALGISMTGSGAYMRHQEIAASVRDAAYAQRDFRNQWKSYDEFRSAWMRMDAAQKHALAADLFDGLATVLDLGVLTQSLKAASVAKRVRAVDDLIKSGKGAEAFEAASRLRMAEEDLQAAKGLTKISGADPHSDMIASMRKSLTAYGPRVAGMAERELSTLDNIESRLRDLLKDGLLDEAVVTQFRRRIADTIVSPERLARLLDGEVVDLYRLMQASGRFSGASGRKVQNRFADLFDRVLRQRHPEISEEQWKALSREDKMSVLEGRFTVKRLLEVAVAPGVSRSEALVKEINAAPEIQRLRERHRVFTQINEADNAHWMALNQADDAKSAGYLYFEVDAAIIQSLNDVVILNKDTVTAFTNQFKEILFANVQKNPLLRHQLTGQYSDFKALRLIFADRNEAIVSALREAYEQSVLEFGRAMAASPLKSLYADTKGLSSSPASWHLAGFANTGDEASSAARQARRYFMEERAVTPMVDFSRETAMLEDRWRSSELIREEIQSRLGKVPRLMVPIRPGSTKMVPSDSAFELMRKVKANGYDEYVQAIQSRFKRRFGVTLDPDQVLDLRDYVTLVDSFSAGLIMPKRVVIDLSEAKNGILSWDLAGAGAQNLQRTASELAKASSSMSAEMGVVGGRQAERAVTIVMRQKLEAIRGAVQEVLGVEAAQAVRATGDDVYCLLPKLTTLNDRIKIHKAVKRRLAEWGFDADRVRATYQPQRMLGSGEIIPAGTRSGYIVEAEKIEKSLRLALERTIDYERLKKIGIAVEYVPSVSGQGVVSLILTGDADYAIVKQVRAELDKVLPANVIQGKVTDATWLKGEIPIPAQGAPAPRAPPVFLAPPRPPIGNSETIKMTREALDTVSNHVVESGIYDRASVLDLSKRKIQLSSPTQGAPSVSFNAQTGIRVEAIGGAKGVKLIEVQVLSADAQTILGKYPKMKGGDNVESYFLPVDAPVKMRLVLEDGKEVLWAGGYEPPQGFRWEVTPNAKFGARGFSGGHTREAWDKLRAAYGDLIRKTETKNLTFRVPGAGHDTRITAISYEYGTDANRVAVKYPKSFFEGATSRADLKRFEEYMTPWVASACEKAARDSEFVSVDVPVQDVATGANKFVRVTIIRRGVTPKDPVGQIGSWYFDVREW